MSARVLRRSFYDRSTLVVAEELLGKVLVCRKREGMTAGMIVETEAYTGEDDPACHASAGLTKRNAPLYGPPGLAYVYLNYGIHSLLNAVTERAGHPAAVLIRALRPLEGVPLMRGRRQRGEHLRETDLCRGPGNLTRAMGITLADNTCDLTGSALTIEDRGYAVGNVLRGTRIGIRVGLDRPWRYWVEGHPSVSVLR
jgi:DNA-3-methyladenine glycosylase